MDLEGVIRGDRSAGPVSTRVTAFQVMLEHHRDDALQDSNPEPVGDGWCSVDDAHNYSPGWGGLLVQAGQGLITDVGVGRKRGRTSA